MPEALPLRLPRRLDALQAETRLRRLRAETFEAATLTLWAHALGARDDAPAGWLLCHARARRALLWPHALPAAPVHEGAEAELRLAASLPPSADVVSRLWFWERMVARRHWQVTLRGTPARAVALPLWLGYSPNRRGGHRLMVISGLGGDALPTLKNAVLWELRQLAAAPAGAV